MRASVTLRVTLVSITTVVMRRSKAVVTTRETGERRGASTGAAIP
jgi:hypothetical protein